MNDRFKFRVWNKKENHWENPVILEVFKEDGLLRSMYDPSEDYIIQQCTGVRDINNKLIFEGDIIKTLDSNLAIILEDVETPKYDKGQVEFICQEYRICQSYVGAATLGDYVFCDCCPQALEVIGNIFENPELCEK